jgi:hypothetical protein
VSDASQASREAVQERMAELFVQLCGDPDDAAVADAADELLYQLDKLLARPTA